MKTFFSLYIVIACLGCSAPKEDTLSTGAANPAGNKGVSSAIESFFEPTVDQKAHSDKMKARQEEIQQQASEMQKQRLQTY